MWEEPGLYLYTILDGPYCWCVRVCHEDEDNKNTIYIGYRIEYATQLFNSSEFRSLSFV